MATRARKTTLAAGALLLAAALVGCGGGDGGGGGGAGGGDELELVSPGTLTVCSDIPYPPFEFEKGGQYTGFDMDIMKEVASGLDLELTVKDSSFDGLQSGLSLNSSQCDIVASAMTITEQREENIDFTEPYYDSKQSLLVPAGSDVKSIQDLAGKRVGVQQGTTGKTYTEENAPGSAEVVSFPSDAEMYAAIQAGQVDALLQDLPVNLSHTEDGEYEIVEEYDTDEQYGFAVREEGSENLLKAVNEQLKELQDSGRYQEIYDSYFATS
jgi:polar amino acid transport system substrate-binding protein